MSADARVAAQWNNRDTLNGPMKRTGPQLKPLVGVPGDGVPIGESSSQFKDVRPALPTGSTNPAMAKNSNIWKMVIFGAGLLFLLHLARG